MTKSITKLAFFGTSEFGIPTLEMLLENYNVVAVVTTPDKPAGRKQILTPSPIKKYITQHNSMQQKIQVLQPKHLKSDSQLLAHFYTLSPDVCIVASYGKIIPKEILDIPKHGFLNIHPSLLPKYRGPTPIQTALLNGDTETGVTIIAMDAEMDHGPIIATRDWQLATNKYHQEIHDELSWMGAQLLKKTLPRWLHDEIQPQPQDHAQATYTRKFTREDGRIDWQQPAEQIYNQIRALNPEPGTWTTLEMGDQKLTIGKNITIKILKATPLSTQSDYNNRPSGTVIKIPGTKNAAVICGSDIMNVPKKMLELTLVQIEGKKTISGRDFLATRTPFLHGYHTQLK